MQYGRDTVGAMFGKKMDMQLTWSESPRVALQTKQCTMALVTFECCMIYADFRGTKSMFLRNMPSLQLCHL